MLRFQKEQWCKDATNEELLRQLVNLEAQNEFGKLDEDIEITRSEILRRMNKEG